MERVTFLMKIKPGTEAEYRERHRHVWPELLADLKRAGCHNYSIYLRGEDLFAYMEVEDSRRFQADMARSEADQRWQAYMSDILIREVHPETGLPEPLAEVFHLD